MKSTFVILLIFVFSVFLFGFFVSDKVSNLKSDPKNVPKTIDQGEVLSGIISFISKDQISIITKDKKYDFSINDIEGGDEIVTLLNEGKLFEGVAINFRILENKVSDLEIAENQKKIIIISPAHGSFVGLKFNVRGYYLGEDNLTIKLRNNRTGSIYVDNVINTSRQSGSFSISLDFDLKTAIDLEDKDSLLLSIISKEETLEVNLKVDIGPVLKIKIPFVKNNSCSNIIFVDRVVSASRSLLRASIEELIGGKTESEKQASFLSGFDKNAKIRVLKFDNDVVTIDFSNHLQSNAKDACKSKMMKAQLQNLINNIGLGNIYIFKINGNDWIILNNEKR